MGAIWCLLAWAPTKGAGSGSTRSTRSISRALPGTEGAFGPFWSPDGLAVGFFTHDRLKRVSISGGDVATICDARYGGGATWNRDGVILFAPAIDSALFRVPATGGTPTPVTVLDPAHEEGAHVKPLFLPDGRHFLFGIIGGDTAGQYVASLDSPERKRFSLESLMLGFSAPDFLFFMRDRTLMAQRFDLKRLESDWGANSRGGRGRSIGIQRHLRRLRERYAGVLDR